MNKFDKNIRKKLVDAEMSVSEGIWEAIEARIIPKKDNSRYWFFFLLPFLFLPALLVYQFNGTTIKKLPLLHELEHLDSGDMNPIASIDVKKKAFGFKLSPFQEKVKPVVYSEDLVFSEQLTDLNNSAALLSGHSSASREASSLYQSPLPLLKSSQLTSLSSDDTDSGGGIRNNFHTLSLFSNKTGSDCPSFEVYHPGFYLYAQHSSDIPFQSLSAKNAEFVEYIQKRKNTESSAYSFSTTLGIGYMFDNGIVAESGLSLDRINMKFHHLDQNAIKNSTVITIDTMILNDIDTIIQTDTMIVQQTGINEVTTYNSFTQIDIPLVLGYEFPISERFRLSLKGGVMINIRSSNKGNMLGLNDFPIAYGSNSNNDNAYFKTNIGFSYTGGLNLEADINESFSLYAGVNIRYYPNSFSLPANQVNEEYTKLGLMTGIKYRL